jgi:hypothetical protein
VNARPLIAAVRKGWLAIDLDRQLSPGHHPTAAAGLQMDFLATVLST